MSEYYTLAEAQAMVGRRFKATFGYSGIPPGTVGRVTSIYAANEWRGEYGLNVAWESPSRRTTDGFSRTDMEMVFTGGSHKGERVMEEVPP